MPTKTPPVDSFNPDDPLSPVGNESARANKALRDYAMLGSHRSMRELQKRYQDLEDEWTKNPKRVTRPPTTRWMTLSNWSVSYRWQERVKLYDEVVRQHEQVAFEQDRLRWRENRLRAAKGLLSKAVTAMQQYDPSRADLPAIVRAIETSSKLLREEFGEEVGTDGNEVVIKVIREDKRAADNGGAG